MLSKTGETEVLKKEFKIMLEAQIMVGPSFLWLPEKNSWLRPCNQLKIQTVFIPEQNSKLYQQENQEENSTTLRQNFKVVVFPSHL